MKINLVMLSNGKSGLSWPLGEIYQVQPNAFAVSECITKYLENSPADAWLFWDSNLGLPNSDLNQFLVNNSIDVWHAGLKLGMGGQPDFIDFVSPTWMLNRDPDPEIAATSWRLSLRACLIRCEVLRQLGGPRDDFLSLEAAGLELGHRYIQNGVFMRYVPGLLQTYPQSPTPEIPLQDQLLFLKARYGSKWMYWAAGLALLTGRTSTKKLASALVKVKSISIPSARKVYHHKCEASERLTGKEKVSVLIPTINRYPYLRVLLGQLQKQSVAPHEILIIDQTPAQDRDAKLLDEFPDLPIKWFTLEKAGQCSSRNFGLQNAEGDFVLFLDDDDEILPDLIERHLENLRQNRCNVSNGVALEPGMNSLPDDFTFLRLSDVFPTNNSMIKKAVLKRSGLFDLAYDHGQRADGDLGMRIYLSGEKMVLNPDISILHHHAPQGGLRTHKARVDTYAQSRSSVSHFNLLTVSDLYLARRYFTDSQVRERKFINLLGTFSLHGSRWHKVAKAVVALFSLPKNLHTLNKRSKIADQWLQTYPQIPFDQAGDLP